MNKGLNDLLEGYNARIIDKKSDEGQNILIYSIKRHQIITGNKYVGGLADRLKGLMTVFFLAVLSNRRFAVEWDSPISLEEHLLPSKYDWRLRFAQPFINASTEINHVDLVDRSENLDMLSVDMQISEVIGEKRIVVININSFRFKNILTKVGNLIGEDIGYNQAFSAAFNFLFRFVERPETSESRDNLNRLRAGADLMVGVHLRTGAGNSWNDPVLDDWHNYRTVLECAFRQATERGATNPAFWFLSDSKRAREAVLDSDWPYPVFTEAVEASHLDRSDGVDILSHHQTFFDFELLTKSDLVICGEGGFASIAALAGGAPIVKYK